MCTGDLRGTLEARKKSRIRENVLHVLYSRYWSKLALGKALRAVLDASTTFAECENEQVFTRTSRTYIVTNQTGQGMLVQPLLLWHSGDVIMPRYVAIGIRCVGVHKKRFRNATYIPISCFIRWFRLQQPNSDTCVYGLRKGTLSPRASFMVAIAETHRQR